MPEFADLAGANLFRSVELVCRAQVGSEQVEVRQLLPEAALDDSGVREAVEEALRHKLITEILKRWKPHIEIHR